MTCTVSQWASGGPSHTGVNHVPDEPQTVPAKGDALYARVVWEYKHEVYSGGTLKHVSGDIERNGTAISGYVIDHLTETVTPISTSCSASLAAAPDLMGVTAGMAYDGYPWEPNETGNASYTGVDIQNSATTHNVGATIPIKNGQNQVIALVEATVEWTCQPNPGTCT